MPPGVFHNKAKAVRSYEHVFSDVEIYRGLGKTAEQTIRFGETEIQTRDYQVKAWKAVGDARTDDKDSALVHLATGLGKTTVGVVDSLDFATDFYQENGRPPKIMFAVHQKEILDQAAERYYQFAPSLSHGYYADGKTDTKNPITFATMQSLYSNLDNIDPQEFDYIIYDEAHHAQAETYSDVIKHFTPKFKLALTATPDRMDDKDIRDLFGEPVYSKPLAEAMIEGYLANVDYHIVFDEAVKLAMEAGFTPDTLYEIRGLLKNESRNEEIAKQIREEMERIGLSDAKTIIFCQDVSQASEMATLLGGKPYHSGIDEDVRNETLKGFRSNDVQVITTRDMFNEGVDIPDARLLVFLRSTSSRTIFEQQLGRGLRKHAGKDTVSVLDFVANIERLTQVKELSDDIAAVGDQDNEGRDTTDSDGATTCVTSDTKHGLSVHTGHTDFDFEKMTVELLEKYKYLTETVNWSVWTDEMIIERALELSPDEPISYRGLKELEEFPSVNVIRKRFGSLVEFQKACGFEVRDFTSLSDDELVLLALDLQPDTALTQSQMNLLSKQNLFVSPTAITTRFGSLISFQESCGFTSETKDYTKEEAITAALSIQPEKSLSKTDIGRLYKEGLFPYSVTWIQNTFGSIIDFQKECGFISFNARKLSNDDLVSIALQLKPDEGLTEGELDELSTQGVFINASAVKARFGSLDKFYSACGLKVENINSLSDEAIIELALKLKPSGPLSGAEIEALSKDNKFTSLTPIYRRFGTLSDFQRLCGFNNEKPLNKLTNDDLISLALSLKAEAPLVYKDIKALYKDGKFISYDALLARFGTLSDFQEACGFNPTFKSRAKKPI